MNKKPLVLPARDYEASGYQRYLRHALDDVGICGCGSTNKWSLIKDLLERAADHTTNGYFYDPLGDVPPLAVEVLADMLDNRELLEHGTSISGAWLSDKGREVLEFLRKYGTEPGGMDDPIWPMWWCSADSSEDW